MQRKRIPGIIGRVKNRFVRLANSRGSIVFDDRDNVARRGFFHSRQKPIGLYNYSFEVPERPVRLFWDLKNDFHGPGTHSFSVHFDHGNYRDIAEQKSDIRQLAQEAIRVGWEKGAAVVRFRDVEFAPSTFEGLGLKLESTRQVRSEPEGAVIDWDLHEPAGKGPEYNLYTCIYQLK